MMVSFPMLIWLWIYGFLRTEKQTVLDEDEFEALDLNEEIDPGSIIRVEELQLLL